MVRVRGCRPSGVWIRCVEVVRGVGWLVDRRIGWLVACLLACLLLWSVGGLAGWLVGSLLDYLFACLRACFFG